MIIILIDMIMRVRQKIMAVALTAIILITNMITLNAQTAERGDWAKDFHIDKKNFISTGINPFFILKPGYRIILEGVEYNIKTRVIINVLDETKLVDGVETRVVKEKEYNDQKIIEISTNYYAIDKVSNSVYYFGEDVDIYKNNEVTGHEGSWQTGKDNAKFGLMMPGITLFGSQYYQEIAPGIAMDRAKIISVNKILKTPAGTFSDCIETEETTPLEPGVKEYKIYAPGVGLIKDGRLLLIHSGYKK